MNKGKPKRRIVRELSFKSIYQMEFQDLSPSESVRMICQMEGVDDELKRETERLINKLSPRLPEIDEILSERLVDWSIGRLSIVSKSILRIGIYELLFEPLIPVEVSINEAVELSKNFGTDGDRKFINGVLDRVAKTLVPSQKFEL